MAERAPELTVAGLVFFEVFAPTAERPAAGREVFVDRIPVGIGGAANTASVAAALGLAVDLAHPAGDGLTDVAIRAALEGVGVRSAAFPGPDDAALSLVFSPPGGDRAFLSTARYDALTACPPLRGAWIHVPGLAEAAALAEPLARARAAGARVSVSATWSPEHLEALPARPEAWDLLFINEDEARQALGSVDGAVERLRRVASSVVLTRGPAGAEGVLFGERVRRPALGGDVVDTTGAGDAFAAGVVAGAVRGLAPEECLALGHRAAARQLTVRGGFADPDRYRDLRLYT